MENTQTSNKKYAIIAIISVVVLLVLFAAGWFLVKYYKDKSAISPTTGVRVEKEVSGTILVSAAPLDVPDGLPMTYAIEASSTAINPIYQNSMESDNLFISHTSISPNKRFYITGGISMNVKAENAGDSMNLYSGEYNGTLTGIKENNIIAKFGTSADSKGAIFRNPTVGNHGGILYSVPPKNVNEVNFDWEIHYNAAGTDIHVANGLSPKWVSNNEFVYLSSKAIRIHDLSTGSDSVVDVVTSEDGRVLPIKTNMSLGVSNDGNTLAFSLPNINLVYIFTRQGSRYVVTKSFSEHGFWPTFSPKGDILAIQKISDTNKEGGASYPEIVFYDLDSEKPEQLSKVVNLYNYRNSVFFINDWN